MSGRGYRTRARPGKADPVVASSTRMSPKHRVGLAALALCLGLDQLSKHVIGREIAYGERVPVIDGVFALTHLRNSAASFGLFAGGDPTLRLGLFVVAAVVGLGLIAELFRRVAPGDRGTALALGAIAGGALGNLIDRLTRGGVVDFLVFELPGGYTWPAFNFADSFVVVGVAWLVFRLLRAERASA
jgi:signal peptidase II